MTSSTTRDQFVERARYTPKNIFGVMTALGYLFFIAGVADLIIALSPLLPPGGLIIHWQFAVASTLFGGALMAGSSWLIQRRFREDAYAAGYSPEQINEIEDEAERLNEEED